MIIDPEFRSILPALTEGERQQLEANLLAEGWRESAAIVCWAGHGIIVDGHNRYELCLEHGIEFRVSEVEFPDRESVRLWIIRNQLGQRNLTPFARSEVVLASRDLIRRRARDRQRGGQGGVLLPANWPEANPVETRDELARLAGVSPRTMARVMVIDSEAPEEVKEQLRNGETSIHAAYQELRGGKAEVDVLADPVPTIPDQSESWGNESEDEPESVDSEATEDEDEPEAEPVPTDPDVEWSASELQRRDLVMLSGSTVLANQHDDHRLIAWAKARGLYIPIDRSAYPLGNPMRLDAEHDRDMVISWYRDHWIPFHFDHIPWDRLAGKVLGCWCHPEPCHGDVIIENIPNEHSFYASKQHP